MKRLIAVLLCALLLAGCQTEKTPYIPTGNGLYQDDTTPTEPVYVPGAENQALSLGYDSVAGLNPYQTASSTNRLVFNLLYQGLFTVDAAYQPHPILCKNYRISKDMRTYTFYLEGATFSDGSVVTAQDVAASLLAAKEGPVYRGRFKEMSDVQVTEDGGVQVSLNIPYENLPVLLDVPIVKAGDVAAETPMGTGPYFLVKGLRTLYLQQRTDWWCRASLTATAMRIPLVDAQNASQLRDAFEFGNISFVCADPGSENYVDFRCDYELWDCESGYFLYLACNEKSSVFSNKTIRAALTHAIDREMLVDTYFDNFALSTTLPASPESPYYDEKLASNYGYDAQLFAQAVADAQLESNSVTLLVNSADGRRVRIAREIGRMLEDCGLSVTISALADTSYTSALKKGSFDLHLGQTKLSANMDLTAFFSTEGALNFGSMADAICYSLCQEAMANTGNYYSLHRTIMNDGMLCPILFRSYAIYVARGVMEDLRTGRDTLFFYTLGKTMEDVKLDN